MRINIHPFGDMLPQATLTTPARIEQLDYFRLVLPAGKKLPQQQLDSVITIRYIEGAIGIEVYGHSQLMRPGTMLFSRPENPTQSNHARIPLFWVTMLAHRE
jgi:hypothetical protein